MAMTLSLAGCSSNAEEYLEIVRARRRAIQDITGILEQIRDRKDMAAAKEQLDDRYDRLEAVTRKARALPQPPPAEVRELAAKEGLDQALSDALQALQKEVVRVRKLEGGEQFFEQFGGHRSLLP